VVTTELVEGTAGADLAFGRLGKGRAFVVNDQTGFGQGLARTFAERFVHDGGPIIDPSDLGAFGPDPPADSGAAVARAREPGAACDATTIVIRALSRAIDDAGGKTPTREQVLTEISRTSNDAGAMGTMSFDAQGDTTLKLLAAYQWVAAAEGTGRFLADLVVR